MLNQRNGLKRTYLPRSQIRNSVLPTVTFQVYNWRPTIVIHELGNKVSLYYCLLKFQQNSGTLHLWVMSSRSTVTLYRHILKNAKTFPSKNRLGILREIKVKFRENQFITDQTELATSLRVAKEGLAQLSMYNNLKDNSGDWSVTLAQEPMPPRNK